MNSTKQINPNIFRVGGIAGILIGIFLLGVMLQITSGWFPEGDLQNGEMTDWLNTVTTNRSIAFTGIGISIFCIILFIPFGWSLYKLFSPNSWVNFIAISIYRIGTSLSLAAFTFGFGFTWGLIDVVEASTGNSLENLSNVASMGMRGFLWADDLATSLLGLGHILFSIEGLRSKKLPKWICLWGIIGGLLVILVVLRYLFPFFEFAAIGYMIFTLWWVFTGIFLLRKGKYFSVKKLMLGIFTFLLIHVIVLISFVNIGGNREFDAPYPNISASSDSTIIARGEYLAFGPGLCSTCHVPSNKIFEVENGLKTPLSGGWELKIPPGTFRAVNLTPDKETGIGNISDSELARSIRYGVGHDNRLLMNIGMPFPKINEQDLIAIISFLRSQTPVNNIVETSEYSFMGKALLALGLLKPEFNKVSPAITIEKDTTVEYGSYLAKNITNCMICHSNINPQSGKFIDPPFSGGFDFGKDPNSTDKHGYISPNITPHNETGIMANWTEDMFITRFKSGRIYKGSPMPWGALSRMDTTDIKAIYRFIQSLDPIDNKIEKIKYIPEKD